MKLKYILITIIYFTLVVLGGTKLFKPNNKDILPIYELTKNSANCNLLFGDDLQKNNCIRNLISNTNNVPPDEALSTLTYLCNNGLFLACLNTISYNNFQDVFSNYKPIALNLDNIINRCDGIDNDEFNNLTYLRNKDLYCSMVMNIAKHLDDKILYALAIQNMCFDKKKECISTSSKNIHFSLNDNYKFQLNNCSKGKEVDIFYCESLKNTQLLQNTFKETFMANNYTRDKLAAFNKMCFDNMNICRELFSEPLWINRIMDSKTFPGDLKFDKAFYDNYPLSLESAHYIVRHISTPPSRELHNVILKKFSNLFEGKTINNQEDCKKTSSDKSYCFLNFEKVSDAVTGIKDLESYCKAGDKISCEYVSMINHRYFLDLKDSDYIINIHQTLGSSILESLPQTSFYKNRVRIKKDLPILLFYTFSFIVFSLVIFFILFIKSEGIVKYLKSEKIKNMMERLKK